MIEPILTQIDCVLCDVDGVLTDARLVYDADGEHLKTFNARDGHLLRVALRAGIAAGLVSGRDCPALRRRAADLGLDPVLLKVGDKVATIDNYLRQCGGDWSTVAFIGDDLPDLPALRRAACGVAVADAHPRLRQWADVVTRRRGGSGAVAEFLERVLRCQGRWQPEEWSVIHG